MGLLGGSSGKEPTSHSKRLRFEPWVGKTPWRRVWQPTPVFLPGKFHGQRSLAGYSIRHSWVTKTFTFQDGVIPLAQPCSPPAPASSLTLSLLLSDSLNAPYFFQSYFLHRLGNHRYSQFLYQILVSHRSSEKNMQKDYRMRLKNNLIAFICSRISG